VSWWRRIKISAVFHPSLRQDRGSHAATRVIKRNTNRRHMIDDHHGRTARRATLLVRAVDEILGTHRINKFLAGTCDDVLAPCTCTDTALTCGATAAD
jgi:hypothetical protein